MAVLSIDFSSADGDLIPEGDYATVIDKVEAKEGKGGAPNLNWAFTIAEGPHKGRKVFTTTGTGDRAVWKLKEMLRALGIETEGLKMITEDSSNTVIQPRLAGLPATVTVKHREWEGRMRAGVEGIKRGGNGASPNGGPQLR